MRETLTGFISTGDCEALCSGFVGTGAGDDFWSGRVMHHPPWPLRVAEALETLPGVLTDRFGMPDCWLINPNVVLWPDGHPGMPLHSDTGVRQEFPHRQYAGVVRLNDEYSGGGTIFEEGERVTLYPGVGELLLFDGGTTRHGVEAVRAGDRYTLVFWLSDRSKWPERPEC